MRYTDDYIKGYREGYTNALDTKDNFKYEMFGMDLGKVLQIVGEHVRKENKSEIPDIPIGFNFTWNDRVKINEFFAALKEQGFKVTK